MSVVTSVEDVVDANHLETPTWVTSFAGLPRTVNVRRCRLEVVAGADAGKIIELAQPSIMIGRTGADLTVNDPKVSGLHCELRLQADGYRLRDLGSTNGTHVKGVRIVDGFIPPGATIQIGKSAVVFDPLDDAVSVPLWHESRLHTLIGGSASMRHLFDLINRFAQSDATVLIQGETGAGKEGVADAIHQCSPRRDGPFVVLDCSAIPEQLFEDQIFGHEQGAFTGAGRATIGVFEAAHGGTLFLDEIGELPLDVQSKLLRAVETRKVRRIGSTKVIASDVPHHRGHQPRPRDRGQPRHVPLRPVLPAQRRQAGGPGAARAPRGHPAARRALPAPAGRHPRRSAAARRLRRARPAPRLAGQRPRAAQRGRARRACCPTTRRSASRRRPRRSGQFGEVDIDVPFKVAKQKLVDEFDRKYLEALLEAHDNNISAAARAAGIERMSIYKMIRRLGLDKTEARDGDDDADDDGSTGHQR